MKENNIVLIINGALTAPADQQSKSLLTEINKFKCEYAALDVKGKPAFLQALPKEQKVPYVFLKGKPVCGLDGFQ